MGRSDRRRPCLKTSTICCYAESERQSSVMLARAASGAAMHELMGRQFDVDVAGARDKASTITLSFPAIHLI